ncbi:metallopeptidase TldD-related protein [Coxiella endosymbiont of Amblyomma americanum]|uniref:metallopeptidase TldD-related protein n=1 Tax=Coxiella endosymbiont of Amblyomma americanum TaxID=325775 RepID=UPI00210FBD1D|nr:metallopeptidase TldD-related protein [Coxiella endosymbiont of Amblyomma americanum]
MDDGTTLDRIGFLNVDNEGIITQKPVLIDNGILKLYAKSLIMRVRDENIELTSNG